MAIYKVWTQDVNGTWLKYEGDDRAAFDAAVAKEEAWKNRLLSCGMNAKGYFTQINEQEIPAQIEDPQEEVRPAEQEITPVASAPKSRQYQVREGDPTDDWDSHCAQSRATRMDTFRPAGGELWAVMVVGNRRTGGRLSTKNIYAFSTLEEAKACVLHHSAQWSEQATIYHRSHVLGQWLSWQQEPGCYYSSSDEYQNAWKAGAFHAAFKRDCLNDEAMKEASRSLGRS